MTKTTTKKFVQTNPRKIRALDDIAVLEGTGKYNSWSNHCYGDGYYAMSLQTLYADVGDSISAIKRWARSKD